MMKTLHAEYAFTTWNETDLDAREDGVKLTKVDATFTYTGDLVGTAKVWYILQYLADGTGSFSGWESFEGSAAGAAGKMLIRHEGTFDPKGVDLGMTAVKGSQTEGLRGFAGTCQVRMEGHGPYQLKITVD